MTVSYFFNDLSDVHIIPTRCFHAFMCYNGEKLGINYFNLL